MKAARYVCGLVHYVLSHEGLVCVRVTRYVDMRVFVSKRLLSPVSV